MFMLFFPDLSSRSAILSFIHMISSLWALWASTSVLKDMEYSPCSFPHDLICLPLLELPPGISLLLRLLLCRDDLKDISMSFKTLSDTGWPDVGNPALGLGAVSVLGTGCV